MRPTRHFMIDFETIDLRSPGRIPAPWQFGLAEFTLDQNGETRLVGNSILAELCPSQIAGLVEATLLSESAGTIEWTKAQPTSGPDFLGWHKAFDSYDTLPGTLTIAELVGKIGAIGVDENSQMWCKGADFDFTILSHLYAIIGARPQWHYRHQNCLRTKLNEAIALGIDVGKPNPAHTAYADCLDQISLLGYVSAAIIAHHRHLAFK